MNSIFVWVGPGRYGTRSIGDATWYYWVASADVARSAGLGAAEWYDSPPAWADEVK